MNKIFTLESINSRRDIHGNCYFAFVFTDHKTGKMARGTVSGGESNVRSIAYEINGQHKNNFVFHSTELPIRQFNRHTKGWKYGVALGKSFWSLFAPKPLDFRPIKR